MSEKLVYCEEIPKEKTCHSEPNKLQTNLHKEGLNSLSEMILTFNVKNKPQTSFHY